MDKITRIARAAVGHSEAFLAFVDKSRIYIKSATGKQDFSGILNNSSEWKHFLISEEQQVITHIDVLNKLFGDAHESDIGFCVTTPLRTMESFIIGSLIVFGKQSSFIEAGKLSIIDGLSQILMDQLAIRLRAKKAF